jgi:hypothetical protein
MPYQLHSPEGHAQLQHLEPRLQKNEHDGSFYHVDRADGLREGQRLLLDGRLLAGLDRVAVEVKFAVANDEE